MFTVVLCYCAVDTRFSVYCSWQNAKKYTERTEEPLPAHRKSNIKLNTVICLRFMYITCNKSAADIKLFNRLIVSADTSTAYGQLCWLTGLQNQETSGL